MAKVGRKPTNDPAASTLRTRLHNSRYHIMRRDVDEAMARVTGLERSFRLLLEDYERTRAAVAQTNGHATA